MTQCVRIESTEGFDVGIRRDARTDAQLLGWLDERFELTERGRTLQSSVDPELVARSVAETDVVREWMRWAGVDTLAELEPDSAEAFLERETHLSAGPRLVRSTVLHAWVLEAQLGRESFRRVIQSCSLDDLAFPKRLRNWARMNDVGSLAEMLTHPPAHVLRARQVGRSSIREADQLVWLLTGKSWQEHVQEFPQSEPRAGAHPLLAGLLGTLPERAVGTPLAHLPSLPKRMRSFARRNGIHTVGELLTLPAADFERGRNLGPRTLEASAVAIRELGGDPAQRPLRLLLQIGLEELDPRARFAMSLRLGCHGPAQGPSVTCELLGCERAELAKLEARAKVHFQAQEWIDEAQARLDQHIASGLLGLDELLARDPWWGASGWATPSASLAFVFRVLLPDPRYLVEVAGHWVVTCVDQDTIDHSLEQALERCAGLRAFVASRSAVG